MRSIWKFPIPVLDRPDGLFSIDMPKGAVVRTAGELMARSFIWAEVDTAQPTEPRSFARIGTGDEIPEGYDYVRTWQSVGGVFVWHLYQRLV